MNPNKLDIKLTVAGQTKCLSVDLPTTTANSLRTEVKNWRDAAYAANAALDNKHKHAQYLESEVERLKNLSAKADDLFGALKHKTSECETLRTQLGESLKTRAGLKIVNDNLSRRIDQLLKEKADLRNGLDLASKQRDEDAEALRKVREHRDALLGEVYKYGARVSEDTQLLRRLLGLFWVKDTGLRGRQVRYAYREGYDLCECGSGHTGLNEEMISAMRRFNLIP